MSDGDSMKLGEILVSLFQTSRELWDTGTTLEGKKIGAPLQDDYDKLSYVKPPVAVGKLENIIRNRRKLLLEEPFYLPPLRWDREFVPILASLRWNFKRSWSDISIRVEMYRYVQVYPGGSRAHLRSVGYRFEMHKPKKSSHDFMHMQATHQGCPDWLPTTLPCIPTVAKGPVSLFLCVLFSFYGKNMCNLLFPDTDVPPKYLKTLKDLLAIQAAH